MIEQIYYVDEEDRPTGEVAEKLTAHTALTRLHAAFSCYAFRADGQFLVTQRAAVKKVWPNVWTNTCCGHPLPGEDREAAIQRRLSYELGVSASDIELLLLNYRYVTPPYNGIIENEFCPIFRVSVNAAPKPNPAEVEDLKWVDWAWFIEQTETDTNDYSDPTGPGAPIWSWWCKDQIQTLIRHSSRDTVLRLCEKP